MTNGVVWRLPVKSQEFAEIPRLSQKPLALELAYDFETESGAYAWEHLAFLNWVAYRFTAAPHCTVEQIHTFDVLVEVGGSTWLSELAGDTSGLHHYRIYFDEIGCYEVLARGFLPPPTME